MNAPKVSVIIPVYNTEPYVTECLQSVFTQQGAPNYEVIVVNDCSPDRSMDEVARFPEATVLHHASNKGLSEARNTGIRAAKGEYLLFVDSDDVLSPDALRRLYSHVEVHPHVEVVYGPSATSLPSKETAKYFNLQGWGARHYSDSQRHIRRVHNLLPETAWNRLIRRQWLVDNNLFFTPGILHEDFDWHLRALDHITSYAAEFGTPTYVQRLRDGSITALQTRVKKSRAFFEIINRVVPQMSRIDAPVLRRLADLLILHRRFMATPDDKRVYREILKNIASHPSAKMWHRLYLLAVRIYPSRLPRKPVLFLLGR